jgi:hypothetical protein
MSFLPAPPPSRARQFLALVLGIITLLCVGLYWLTFAFFAAQVYTGVNENPALFVFVAFITLLPAALCTVLAMFVAGARYCKLAWISLSTFALPFVAFFHYLLSEAIRALFS